jgi:chromosome segregation ATPase
MVLRSVLSIALFAGGGLAFAQAPVEDRSPRQDPVVEGQQRVEFARSTMERAEQNVRDAEQRLKQAEAASQEARAQADSAKVRAEQAKKDLADARAKAVQSKGAYDKESENLIRVRRQPGEPGKRG